MKKLRILALSLILCLVLGACTGKQNHSIEEDVYSSDNSYVH